MENGPLRQEALDNFAISEAFRPSRTRPTGRPPFL